MALCKKCDSDEISNINTDIYNLDKEIKNIEDGLEILDGCLACMECTEENLKKAEGSYVEIGANPSFAGSAFANSSSNIQALGTEKNTLSEQIDSKTKLKEELEKAKEELQNKLKSVTDDCIRCNPPKIADTDENNDDTKGK